MIVRSDPHAHSTTHHSARTKPWRVEYKLERPGARPRWLADTFETAPLAAAFARIAVECASQGCVYAVVTNRKSGEVYDSYGWNGVSR